MQVRRGCEPTLLTMSFNFILPNLNRLLHVLHSIDFFSWKRVNRIVDELECLIRCLDSFSCSDKRFRCCILKFWVRKLLFVCEVCAGHSFSAKNKLSMIDVVFAISNHLCTLVRLVFLGQGLVHKRFCLNSRDAKCVYLIFGFFVNILLRRSLNEMQRGRLVLRRMLNLVLLCLPFINFSRFLSFRRFSLVLYRYTSLLAPFYATFLHAREVCSNYIVLVNLAVC